MRPQTLRGLQTLSTCMEPHPHPSVKRHRPGVACPEVSCSKKLRSRSAQTGCEEQAGQWRPAPTPGTPCRPPRCLELGVRCPRVGRPGSVLLPTWLDSLGPRVSGSRSCENRVPGRLTTRAGGATPGRRGLPGTSVYTGKCQGTPGRTLTCQDTPGQLRTPQGAH